MRPRRLSLGTGIATDIAGHRLLALRGKNGVLRAFHNVCRHPGRPSRPALYADLTARVFGASVGMTSVLSLVVYGLCSVSLFRLARWTRARSVAALGLLFTSAAVVAAAPGYILPTAVFFVVTTGAWFASMGKRAASIDPEAAPL